MIKIYLMESNKGKVHLATKLYLHDGSHEDVIEITVDGFNRIKDKLNEHNNYIDIHKNKWYLRNSGITNEVYFASGIKSIREVILKDFNDVYNICVIPNVCAMDKVRLLELWDKY